MSGQPAASVPLHWAPGGLPIGVQLVADYGREDVFVHVCGQLEEAKRWAGAASARARVTPERPTATPAPCRVRGGDRE